METQYNAMKDMIFIGGTFFVIASLWVIFYVQPRTNAINQVVDCMPDRSVESYEACKDVPNEGR